MSTLLLAFWFFAPAGPANFAPVFAKRIPWLNQWNTPLDFGRTYRGKRIFGKNKTWRGLLSGVAMGVVIAALQYSLWIPPELAGKSWGFYLGLGGLLGFGALAGDAIESFAKRQAGIAPGKSWFPFDQVDFVVGGVLASLLITRMAPIVYLWIFVIYFGLHILFAYIGYILHLKDKPI